MIHWLPKGLKKNISENRHSHVFFSYLVLTKSIVRPQILRSFQEIFMKTFACLIPVFPSQDELKHIPNQIMLFTQVILILTRNKFIWRWHFSSNKSFILHNIVIYLLYVKCVFLPKNITIKFHKTESYWTLEAVMNFSCFYSMALPIKDNPWRSRFYMKNCLRMFFLSFWNTCQRVVKFFYQLP